MKTDWTTSIKEDSSHSVNDGAVTYYANLAGKTHDEVAAQFRIGYDGDLSDGGFEVTDLADGESETYDA